MVPHWRGCGAASPCHLDGIWSENRCVSHKSFLVPIFHSVLSKLAISPFPFGRHLKLPQRGEVPCGLGPSAVVIVYLWTWCDIMCSWMVWYRALQFYCSNHFFLWQPYILLTRLYDATNIWLWTTKSVRRVKRGKDTLKENILLLVLFKGIRFIALLE